MTNTRFYTVHDASLSPRFSCYSHRRHHPSLVFSPAVLTRQIRQYFKDPRFYANDVMARGFCGTNGSGNGTEALRFPCEAFSPSSATVKVSGTSDLNSKFKKATGGRKEGRECIAHNTCTNATITYNFAGVISCGGYIRGKCCNLHLVLEQCRNSADISRHQHEQEKMHC